MLTYKEYKKPDFITNNGYFTVLLLHPGAVQVPSFFYKSGDFHIKSGDSHYKLCKKLRDLQVGRLGRSSN